LRWIRVLRLIGCTIVPLFHHEARIAADIARKTGHSDRLVTAAAAWPPPWLTLGSPMPPARSKARKRALDILFEAEQRGSPVLDLLAERITLGSPPVPAYAAELVRGVAAHSARIDELISLYAEGWTLDRMPAVDRNVLRIGVYELLWAPDVPDGVAISEAVLLARDLSTDASPAFVNGLLARIAELKPTLQA
jgi:transcription antitermination protein NusB